MALHSGILAGLLAIIRAIFSESNTASSLRAPPPRMTTIASGGIWFWISITRTLVSSFAVGYLWSAAVGIYLLLRRQVDSTEMDEVVVTEQRHDLPRLDSDPSGVPGVG